MIESAEELRLPAMQIDPAAPAEEPFQHQEQDALSEADILGCDVLYKIQKIAADLYFGEGCAFWEGRAYSNDDGMRTRKESIRHAYDELIESYLLGDWIASIERLVSFTKALGELKCRASFLNGKSLSQFELASMREAGMRAGRRSSLTAARKSAAVRLYAERRDSTASPHDAAKQLQDEIVRMAQEMGKPLSADRAFDTIYEWFREHDKKHPRNQ